MKPNASFKLSKQSKIHVANYLDPHLRGQIRRSFIEAQLSSLIQPRVVKAKREEKESE